MKSTPRVSQLHWCISQKDEKIMKKSLVFGSPIIAQNPNDALELSIIDAHNLQITLLNSYWETYGTLFFDNGYYYFDTHIRLDNDSIKNEKVYYEDVDEEFILTFLKNIICKGKYVHLNLDWLELKCLNQRLKEIFLHPVTIYGFDDENQIFEIADFKNGYYAKMTATYYEIKKAFQSTVRNMKDERGEEKNSFQLKYVVTNEVSSVSFSEIKNCVNLFLCENSYQDSANKVNGAKVSRMVDGVFYKVSADKIVYGFNVFQQIAEYMKHVSIDNRYVFEMKAVYLIYSHIKLFEFRWDCICNNEYNFDDIKIMKISALSPNIKELTKKARIMLNLGIKYQITKAGEVLLKMIRYMEEVIKQYEIVLRNFADVI